MTEWQPIETAPRDGTRILAFLPGTNPEDDFHAPEDVMIVSWDEHCEHGFGWLIDQEENLAAWCNPTHWMPLPSAPGIAPGSA